MDDNNSSLDILGIKPVADSVNRLTRAAVDGASAFLSRICLPAAEELGLLFRDKIAGWRARNAVIVVERARDKLVDNGVDIANVNAHPRIVGQILESASWTEDDEIQDLWGGLLASSCSEDGRDESNLIFSTLLAQLTSLEARVISYGSETAKKSATAGGWLVAEDLRLSLHELKSITGVDDAHRLDRELDHLRSLELIENGFDTLTQIADITPTGLCLHLYMRCKGHRGTPFEFYNVEDPSSQSSEEARTAVAHDQTNRERKRSRPKADAKTRKAKSGSTPV
jgi:Abortive infection alpha